MPRQLLRDGHIVADDWRYASEAGADTAAETGRASGLILRFEDWLSDRARWLARGGRLGVILTPAHAVELLAADLAHFELVGAEFPNSGEGRGYSQGRLLRERWHFSGELRATGQVLRDQLFFLARCGFNSFELPEGEMVAGAALTTFTAAYQASNDSGLAAALRRR